MNLPFAENNRINLISVVEPFILSFSSINYISFTLIPLLKLSLRLHFLYLPTINILIVSNYCYNINPIQPHNSFN